MAAATPPVCDFDWPAPGFTLPTTDGRTLSRDEAAGEKGLLVMFICNHCPYVLRSLDRIIQDAEALRERGIGVAAICSNDSATHPEDGFGKMAEMAAAKKFPFPYLHDEDQSVARAYGAVCTPDYFGFNAEMGLQYRGRLDGPDGTRELHEAMTLVAETGQGPREQVPSMGCSIKWKAA